MLDGLGAVPDLEQYFSGHSDCAKWIFLFLVHHLLEQVLQENDTFGNGMYDSVQGSVVTPSLRTFANSET